MKVETYFCDICEVKLEDNDFKGLVLVVNKKDKTVKAYFKLAAAKASTHICVSCLGIISKGHADRCKEHATEE